MKKIIIVFSILILGAGLSAQSKAFDQLYSDFRGEKDVINVHVPGFVCRWVSNIDDLENEERELLRSIRSVKVLVIENCEINRQVNLAKLLAGAERDEDVVPMLEIHDEGEDVLILARQVEDKVTDIYVIVGGEANVMVKVSGRMDRDLMKCLYDVTGIEETKHIREI